MKKLLPFLLLMGIILCYTACKKSDRSGGTTPPVTQNDISSVNSKVSVFMSTYNIPGASLAVTKNGKLVYIKGPCLGSWHTKRKNKINISCATNQGIEYMRLSYPSL